MHIGQNNYYEGSMGMQIFITDPYQREGDDLYPRIKDVLEEFKDDFKIENYSEDANIGRGADCCGTLLWIAGMAWIIFSQGKTIEDNLEAWPRLAKRLVALLQKIHKHIAGFRIDKELGRLIAVGKVYALHSEKITSFQLYQEVVMSLDPIDWRPQDQLDRIPESFYHYFFIVNNTTYYVITVSSKGKILETNNYPYCWWDFENLHLEEEP